MGRKHKHAQDKLYKTVSELQSHHVGVDRDLELSTLHRRIKFDTCCLTLTTIRDRPMGLCDEEGYCYVFCFEPIVEFLKKFKVHPVTASKVSVDDLIELKFHKNEDGQYHCPIIFKLFNQHSKMVVNRRTGNVYSHEAYLKLNVKEKNFRDLLTDEAFEEGDIWTLQDPNLAENKWNVSEFHHVKNGLRLGDDEGDTKVRNVEQSEILKSVLGEFKSKSAEFDEEFNRKLGQDSTKVATQVKLDTTNSAVYSDGALSGSVTSTVQPTVILQTPALLNEEQILYPRIKKKGYVQILTNLGPMNIELYCDRCPKTCHNFLLLANRGYYEGTKFHRLIKNFMIQGGDPTGTGTGGQSAWGESFRDECHGDLKHEGRGVVAMANSGINTNKSQFYITLKGKWDHLDGKHTVFGRLVGGEDTLTKIEAVDTDKKDRPKEEIKITKVIVYSDPFEDAKKIIDSERSSEVRKKHEDINKASDKKITSQPYKKFRTGVCAYIDLDRLRHQINSDKSEAESSDLQADSSHQADQEPKLSSRLASLSSRTSSSRSYGDFSSW